MGVAEPEQTPDGSLLIYRADEAAASIRVLLEGETVWLTQKMLAGLYQVGVNTINHHVKGVYEDDELAPEATIRKYRIVQTEGRRQVEHLVDHYNLDMILAVGYRVRSTRGTQFRQWATARLAEYLVKGFTLDDERLKGTASPADHGVWLPRSSVGARADAPASRAALRLRQRRRHGAQERPAHTPTLERGSEVRSCCCALALCFLGFGMGVMKSAGRRLWMTCRVGCPWSSSSQCWRGCS
jgi:hypothetical protein